MEVPVNCFLNLQYKKARDLNNSRDVKVGVGKVFFSFDAISRVHLASAHSITDEVKNFLT